MLGDVNIYPPGDPGDRPLEAGVLEWLHAAAATTDRVMVVVSVRADPLVAGDATRSLKTPNQLQLLELLERPVDAGPRN